MSPERYDRAISAPGWTRKHVDEVDEFLIPRHCMQHLTVLENGAEGLVLVKVVVQRGSYALLKAMPSKQKNTLAAQYKYDHVDCTLCKDPIPSTDSNINTLQRSISQWRTRTHSNLESRHVGGGNETGSPVFAWNKPLAITSVITNHKRRQSQRSTACSPIAQPERVV